jgi:Fe2+ or Zn2+ uptake regulation protein
MLKKTKTRELVKDLLAKSHEPLSASEIYNKLQSENITLSSIYRTLDTFYNHNIVMKNVTSDGTSLYTIYKDKHTHYLECKKCHKSTALDYCPYSSANKKIKSTNDFIVDEHNIIIYGVCKDCHKLKKSN